MMKKVMLLVLILTLLCGAVQAQAMPMAAQTADIKPLERYAAWTETEGEWRVYSNETAAALARMGVETGNAAYFCMQLSGNRAEGLIQPELVVYYTGTNKPEADVVTIAADGKRYDFKVARTTERIGRNDVEVLRAALNEAGIAALRSTVSAEKVIVQLTGEKAYRFEPEVRTTYNSTRQEIEALSFKGAGAMLDELDGLNIAAYKLWDLNADRWERLYGFRPEMEETALIGEVEGEEINMGNDLEMFSRGDNNRSVRAFQNLLIETGYLAGSVDGSFGDGTDRAVRAARRYYGMMENGLADRVLVAYLKGEKTVSGGEEAEKSEMDVVDGLFAAAFDRCWFAGRVTSKGGAERSVSNADNTLFIAEGRMKNLSGEELTFYWQMSAVVKCGEIAFPATIVCEADAGSRFDSSLLPMAESRMFVYAEIPESIAGEGSWAVELTAGENVLTYTVE